MLTVYSCIVNAHDLRLVGLAAMICLLASFTAMTLLHHVRRSTDQLRQVWLVVSATATGFGIWATHFIAMLAFSPGIPSGYNIALTILSLLAAILLTGIGLLVAIAPLVPGSAWLGGTIVGSGIAVLHYTGMAAFEVEGRLVWDPTLVVASMALGGILGAIAMRVGLAGNAMRWRIYGALLLTAAICSHHFTAMGAVSIIPDPRIAVSQSALPTSWLAVGVAFASFAILVLAFGGLALDIREQRRSQLESERMRGLANAAVEGLIICDGEAIATVNESFAELAGIEPSDARDARLETYFPDEPCRRKLMEQANEIVELALRHCDGSMVAVEAIRRPVDFGGKRRQAIAVRDLRPRKEAEEHIRFLAHHDPLTGIPNRSTFNSRLEQEIGRSRTRGDRLAVLCLDLDRFKEINDLFGHSTGDALLQRIATSVSAALGENQMVARLGGDEFAVILPAISGPLSAGRVAESILEAMRAENEQSTAVALVSASIGIALYPDDAVDLHGLLSHADTALYRAKAEGRGTYRFFEAKMGEEVRERRLLEHELRQALTRGEMRLVYQPQKNIHTDKITGLEALLRWKHPSRGEVSPSVFIPIAEESGSILQIGDWVLRTACGEAAKWTRPLTVAVNVSAVQLHNPNFAHLVHEIIIMTGLPPGRLELEITETALISDLNRTLGTLRQLKTLGIRIAMDDFGTGYSSLSNLRAFPFDKIKIDGSFIQSVDRNDQAAAIVRAVLGLGQGLGLPVLAEGVETAGELQFLVRQGACNEVQGYLIGRPSEIDQLRALTHGVVGSRDAAPAQATATEPQRLAG